MADQDRTKEELNEEIVRLRRQVSELEHVKEVLQKSESRFQSLFENMTNAAAVYKAEQGGEDFVLIDFNKAAEKIEQISRDEVIGKSVLKVFPGIKEFGLFEVFQRVWRTGRAEFYPVSEYKDNRIQGWRENFVYRLCSEEIVAVYSDETERKKVEDELIESERKHRALIEEAPVGIFQSTFDGRVLSVNPAYARMYGYVSAEEAALEIDDVAERIYVEPERRKMLIDLALSTDGFVKAENQYRKKDGSLFWGQLYFRVIRDCDGEAKHLEGFVEDITQRKQAQEELRESEERYRAVFDNAGIGVDLLDRDGSLVKVNQALLNILGYTEEELSQRTFVDITHPDDKEISERNLEALIAGEIDSYRLDKRYIRKDGSIVWVDLWSCAIRDGNGENVGTVAVVQDISERRRAEEELNERERFLSNIFVSIQDGISVLDRDLTIIRVNPTMERWYSHAMPLTGKKCHEAYHGISHPCEVCPTLQTLQKGQMAHEVIPRRGLGGVITGWFDLYSFPFVDAITGEIRGIIEYVRDITERKRSEERLQFEKERFEMLAQNSPFGMLMVSQTGNFEYVNPKFKEIFGYDLSEVPNGREWFVRAYPDPTCRKQVIAAWIDDFQGHGPGEARPRVFTVTCKDKSEKIISFTSVRLGTGQDLVTCEDITERKQAEQAQRQSEQRLRLAWETTPDALSISRLKDGVYVEVSEGYSFLTGYEASEILGRSALDIGFWADPADRSSFVATLEKDGHIRNFQTRFRRKDGQERTTLISAGLMTLEGEPHLFAVTKDIEDLKRTEVALRESEEKYRALFEESKDAVFITTREGILLDANQAFLDLFGLGREEATNMAILQIYTDAADLRRFQEEIERKGSIKDYGISFRQKDGLEIDCLLTSSVRRDKDGTILGYQGIIRDVTDLKQIQRQLLQAQKMEAIGQLAGGVAHDFNNILTAIIGYSDVLTQQIPEDSPYRSKLVQINRAGARAAHLTRQLLAFSRKQILDLRPLNLNDVVANFEKMLRSLIGEDIEVITLLGPSVGTIMGDATQIEQILLNLAVNARDAMPAGGKLAVETANVSLDETYARTHSEVRPGPYVMLAVSDTGHGIDVHVLPRIFDPFFTTKGKDKGTGLGLSTVYGIAKQHQGHVTVYSETGRGTTFKVYLPLVQNSSEQVPSVPSDAPQLIGEETILVVEDDEIVRQLTSEVLGTLGYSVILCRDPEEAKKLSAIHEGPIHLLLTDVVLPQMDGRSLFAFLSPLFPNMRVLYVSGYAENAIGHHGVLDPGVKFLQKPFTVEVLAKKIREVLDEP